MAKKQVFEFFFNQLVKGYRSIMGKDPEGLDLIKIKQEARQKLIDQDKVIEVQFGKSFGEEVDDLIKSGDVKIGEVTKKNDNVLQREMFQNSNLNKPTIEGQMEKITGASNKIKQIKKEQADMYKPKTDAEIKAKFEKQNKEAVERLRNKRQLTDDEIRDYEAELGDSETWMMDGTVGEAETALKNQKAYIRDMELEYRKGNLDPKPGEPNRERFLQKKFDEMESSGDNRLMTRDEVEELSSFSLQKDMDKSIKKFKEKDAKQKKTLKDFDPEDRDPNATGGRAGFQQGGLPMVDPRMNLDYDTFVEQNVDKRLQDPTFLNNIKEPEGTLGPITTMPVGEGSVTPILPVEPRNQPGSLEEYLSGYEDYKAKNPNTYIGTQALIPATLPGGFNYTFNSGAHANHFNDYLESIGLSPYERYNQKLRQEDKTNILNSLMPKDMAKGGRAGFYTGGITNVELSLDNIGHGSDSLMSRTRLVSPDGQATTSTGLNYLLAEDNDNMRIPFAKGKIAKEVLNKGRRGFMKAAGAAGAGIAALKTGLLGFGEKAAPVVEKVAETVSETAQGVPPYFFKLVEKIKTMGDDVTEKMATQERQQVTRYKDFELTEDVATGEQTIQRIKIDDGNPQYYDETLAEETYMNYKPGAGQSDEAGRVSDEYTEDTSYIRTSGPQKGEIFDTVDGVPDDVIEEGTMFEDNMTEFGKTKKADGGRIGFAGGKLAINVGRKFLEKVFGKEKLNNIVENDPDLEKGMLEVVEMFRNKDKEGLKMYLQKYLPHMDDAEIEDFIVSSGDSAGIEGQLIRLGSGRDYADKLDMMKQADEIRKLKNFDVEGVSKNAEGGRIGLFMGGGLKAGKGLLRKMLNFMADKSIANKKGSEMLQLVNPKQLDPFLNDPKTMGKVSSEAPEGLNKIINDKKKQITEDRASMVGDIIGSARKFKKVDDDIINYKKSIIIDMVARGIDPKTAAEMAENLAEMVATGAGKKTSPNITEQGLLELENIQKNLLTKDRKLQAQGGLTTMLGE